MLNPPMSWSRHARRGLLAKAAAAVALSGGLLAGVAVPAQAAVPTAVGASVVNTAAHYVGTPYRWGGTTPAGFDCSGYTSFVFRQVGVTLPRTSAAQLGASRRISAAQAVPGDMVFFVSGGRAYHAAVYAGDGYIYDAPGTGRSVSKRKIWTSAVVYGRVLG